MGFFFFFYISPSRVAYFCAVSLLQWYFLYGEQRSRVLLHWFFCFVMTRNSASVLPAKWTRHTCSLCLAHTHWYTMTDSCERITWYKIICYFQTIDLWVTQYNKSLSDASPQQSILTRSPIRCILMMWSMYLLWCWLHRKRASLSREESNKKTNMTRALLWDDIVLYVWASWDGDCGGTRLPWTSSIIQTSGKKPEYISLFIGMYFYIAGSHNRPTLSYNKTWRSWCVRQQSYQQGTSFTDGVTSNGK